MAEGKHAADFNRLEALKGYLGLSYQAIAKQAGVGTAQSFYSVKAGKQGISKNMAERIVATWPEISQVWLLTGRGDMLVRPGNNAGHPGGTGELVTIERRLLDTILSQQETIRNQAASIKKLASRCRLVEAKQQLKR